MRTEIARLDLGIRRRLMIGYLVGMALYTFIVVAMYPAFKDSESLNKLIQADSTAAALFGVSGSITSVGGWLNGNIYANFLPLIMLLLTVGYGASSLAGQDEEGTLCLLATLPIPRSRIVLQKIGAMGAQGAALAVVVGAFVLLGNSFGLAVSFGNVAAISLSSLLLGMDFGLLAMAAGAALGRRGAAIGAATALAAASYLLSSLAPVVNTVKPGRYLSLFYWSIGNGQITAGVSAVDYGVLAVVGVLLAALVIILFRRADLH